MVDILWQTAAAVANGTIRSFFETWSTTSNWNALLQKISYVDYTTYIMKIRCLSVEVLCVEKYNIFKNVVADCFSIQNNQISHSPPSHCHGQVIAKQAYTSPHSRAIFNFSQDLKLSFDSHKVAFRNSRHNGSTKVPNVLYAHSVPWIGHSLYSDNSWC